MREGAAPAAPVHGTLARVNALLPALPPAVQRVARAVVDDPDGIAASSIGDLAERAGTSETTVVRFCRALGVPGYTRPRLTLATEIGRLAGRDETPGPRGGIAPGDDLARVVAAVREASTTAISATLTHLDRDVLGRAWRGHGRGHQLPPLAPGRRRRPRTGHPVPTGTGERTGTAPVSATGADRLRPRGSGRGRRLSGAGRAAPAQVPFELPGDRLPAGLGQVRGVVPLLQ